jgi:predicted O-methyltransferase YrrM
MRVADIAAMNIKGFLAEDEGLRLYKLAKEASTLGPCLEIGGYCGKSTVYLGLGCKEKRGILFSIDHHRGSEEQQPGQEYFDPDLLDVATGKIDTYRFFRNTLERAGLEDTVIPIVATSVLAARAWSIPLGMVYIDGSHAYESVFFDYAAWSSHILPGGYLALHDIFPDPKDGGQAPYMIYTLAKGSGLFKEIPMVKSLGMLRRLNPGEMP